MLKIGLEMAVDDFDNLSTMSSHHNESKDENMSDVQLQITADCIQDHAMEYLHQKIKTEPQEDIETDIDVDVETIEPEEFEIETVGDLETEDFLDLEFEEGITIKLEDLETDSEVDITSKSEQNIKGEPVKSEPISYFATRINKYNPSSDNDLVNFSDVNLTCNRKNKSARSKLMKQARRKLKKSAKSQLKKPAISKLKKSARSQLKKPAKSKTKRVNPFNNDISKKPTKIMIKQVNPSNNDISKKPTKIMIKRVNPSNNDISKKPTKIMINPSADIDDLVKSSDANSTPEEIKPVRNRIKPVRLTMGLDQNLPKNFGAPVKCGVCQRTLSSQINLAMHHRLMHFGEKPFKCEICHQTFSKKTEMHEHDQTHKILMILCNKTLLFICDLCGETNPDLAALENHRKTHNILRLAPYISVLPDGMCSRFHQKPRNYRKHSSDSEVHFQTLTLETAPAVHNITGSKNSPEVQFITHKDIKTAPTIHDIAGSKNSTVVETISTESRGISINPTAEPKKNIPTTVTNNDNFVNSGANSTGKKPFRRLLNPFALTRDLDHSYSIILPRRYSARLDCEVCKKVLSTREGLKDHFRRIHLREKPYQCEICGLLYCRRGEMYAHQKSHGRIPRKKLH